MFIMGNDRVLRFCYSYYDPNDTLLKELPRQQIKEYLQREIISAAELIALFF